MPRQGTPVSYHISSFLITKATSLSQWSNTQGIDNRLLSDLLPGPVTILLPRLDDDPINAQLNPGVNEIGIRVPENSFVCRLSEALATVLRNDRSVYYDIIPQNRKSPVSSVPIVLTSANISGEQSTLSPDVGIFNVWFIATYVLLSIFTGIDKVTNFRRLYE